MGRILRGSGALALSAVASIGMQLLVVPAAIAAWGAPQYGEWIVISGAVTVFQLADLGLQTYVINSICAAWAKEKIDEFHQILWDALAVQTRIVGALILLVCGVLWLAPVNSWLSLHTINRSTAALALGILSVDLLLNIPLGVVSGIYRATGRFARNAMMGVVQKFGALALTLVMLYYRRGFVSLAATRLLVTLAGVVWLLLDFPRLYPWLRFRLARADLRRGLAMLLPGALFLLIPAADYATNQVSLMIAQHQLSGLEVAGLATHRTIFNSAQMASNFLLLAVWPELTVLYAREDRDKMRQVLGVLTRINCLLVLFVVAGMLAASQWLYPMWTRKSLHFDGVLAVLLAAKTLCWGYWSVSSMILMSINRPSFAAKAAAWSGAIATSLSFALIPRIGIRGAALASLIADLAVSVWFVPRCASTLTGGTYREFLLGPTRTAAAAVLVPALLIGFSMTAIAANPTIRAVLLLGALGSLAVGIRFAFSAEERRVFLGLVRRLAGRS